MSHTLATEPPIARNRTIRPDMRRDAPIATLQSASEEDFFKRLREFDRARWSTACRHMQVRVMNGHYEAAHDVLRAFCRVATRVPATLHSHVCNVLPVRIANALEEAGYLTIAAIARASDERLLQDVANFGEVALGEVRRVQAAVLAGTLQEICEDDESLLDDDLLVQSIPIPQCNCRSHAMSESDRLIDALSVLTGDPAKAVEAIDSKIAEIKKTIGEFETQVYRLERLRKTLQPRSKATAAASDKKATFTSDEVEQRVHEWVSENGPAKCAVIAMALGCNYPTIGKAVSSSNRLAKDGEGRVMIIAQRGVA